MGDWVTTEGDELYFEVRGEGPPLLMIAGGQGDAGFSTNPAELLADEYQVVTYDRRGNSRSSRNVTDFSVAQQARDAVAVLKTAGHESAVVFGTSGGAIIALAMAARFPEVATAVIAHEPPLLAVEPDRRSLTMFRRVARTARVLGPKPAMAAFALTTHIPAAAYKSVPADFTARTTENQAFFVRHEMRAFVNHQARSRRHHGAGGAGRR